MRLSEQLGTILHLTMVPRETVVTYIKTQSLPEGTFKRKKKKHLQGDRPPA
jgi:hypothetical protein